MLIKERHQESMSFPQLNMCPLVIVTQTTFVFHFTQEYYYCLCLVSKNIGYSPTPNINPGHQSKKNILQIVH